MSKSPSLEVVSEENGIERRRLPRLNVTSEVFRIESGEMAGKMFSVADLSLGGLSIRLSERSEGNSFPVGSILQGTLNLRREKYPVTVKVRHLGVDLLGLEFENLAAPVRRALESFLDPAALGQELKPIPSAEAGTLWYHGPSGTDLILWRGTDGQYKRLALFVLGSFAQWEQESGISTGRVKHSFEQSEVRGAVHLETLLLNADRKPDEGKLSIAKTLILSSNLPQDLKKWCVRQLGTN